MFNDQLAGLVSEIALILPAFLIIFSFRGFFQALTAKLMGDDTGHENGFLTLNPVAHLDIFNVFILLFLLIFVSSMLGTMTAGFLFVMFILLGARLAIPVPIDENNFKYKTLGIVLTTLSSTISSCVVILLFLYLAKYFPYQLLPNYAAITVMDVFRTTMDLAAFWAALDLIPIPPFNAGRLLRFIVPSSLQEYVALIETYSIYVFLALFFLPGLSTIFFGFLYQLAFFIKSTLFLLVF